MPGILKPQKTTLDPWAIPAGTSLVGAALQHLEQLVGPQPLKDPRVYAHLKVPGPHERERKVAALQGRLERLGVGVLDRYCREVHKMTWRGVSRFIAIGTRGEKVPNERQIEHAYALLLDLEHALGYEHPEPRSTGRAPRLDKAEARWREANERITRAIDGGRNPSPYFAEACRRQADLAELEGDGPMGPHELRELARRQQGVRSYTLSPDELERRFPRRDSGS